MMTYVRVPANGMQGAKRKRSEAPAGPAGAAGGCAAVGARVLDFLYKQGPGGRLHMSTSCCAKWVVWPRGDGGVSAAFDRQSNDAAPLRVAHNHGWVRLECGECSRQPALFSCAAGEADHIFTSEPRPLTRNQGGSGPDPEQLGEALVALDKLALCPCKNYFVLDGGAACFACDVLTASRGPHAVASRGDCPVCAEPVTTEDRTECCRQARIHRSCAFEWARKSPGAGCVLCRRTGARVAV